VLSAPVASPAGVTALPAVGSTQTGALAASAPRRVTVAARLRVPASSLNVVGGQAIVIHGRLLPGVRGRRVRLQGLSGGAWRTLTTARTGRWGGFRLTYAAGGLGREPLRVRFAGDRRNAHASTQGGTLTIYQESVASWYYDGGATACGFHAYYGVANRDLPCGTQVTFRNGGRTVTATVDDRGPFVGGRTWDLNQNAAAALGFGGVGVVWSSA
jgi:hypothetical protein